MIVQLQQVKFENLAEARGSECGQERLATKRYINLDEFGQIEKVDTYYKFRDVTLSASGLYIDSSYNVQYISRLNPS